MHPWVFPASLLAFSRMSGQDAEDVYVMPAEGGEPRRLTFENRIVRDLKWTADGVVKEVLVGDAQPVEFGEPLVLLEA